jgi:hypothetical protein
VFVVVFRVFLFSVDGEVCVSSQRSELTTLEQQDGDLTQVEVDEVTGLVCHVAAKVAANYTMPCWVVFFVELLLDESCNVLRNENETERLSENERAKCGSNFVDSDDDVGNSSRSSQSRAVFFR